MKGGGKLMNTIIGFVKNNSATILKVGGMVLSIGGTILANMASDKQQKIDIEKAVKEFNSSAK